MRPRKFGNAPHGSTYPHIPARAYGVRRRPSCSAAAVGPGKARRLLRESACVTGERAKLGPIVRAPHHAACASRAQDWTAGPVPPIRRVYSGRNAAAFVGYCASNRKSRTQIVALVLFGLAVCWLRQAGPLHAGGLFIAALPQSTHTITSPRPRPIKVLLTTNMLPRCQGLTVANGDAIERPDHSDAGIPMKPEAASIASTVGAASFVGVLGSFRAALSC